MNRNALLKLFGVLIALATLCLIFIYASKPRTAAHLAAEKLADKAAKMELSGPFGRAVLVRSSSIWSMEFPGAYPADRSVIATVLDGMADVRLSDELSRDPSRYFLYGLNESSATRVQIFLDGGRAPQMDFYVGRTGPDYNTFFMHFAREPGVLEAQGLSADAFARKPEEWLDKTVCSVPSDSIVRLNIRSGKDSAALKHADGKWSNERSGRVLSSAAVEQALSPVLDLLKSLQAENILLARNAPPMEKMGLDAPEIAIEAAASGANQSVSLKVGKKDDKGYRYVLRSKEPRVYFLIADWRFEPVRRKELFGEK